VWCGRVITHPLHLNPPPTPQPSTPSPSPPHLATVSVQQHRRGGLQVLGLGGGQPYRLDDGLDVGDLRGGCSEETVQWSRRAPLAVMLEAAQDDEPRCTWRTPREGGGAHALSS